MSCLLSIGGHSFANSLRPKPLICGNTYHIQCPRLLPG